MMTESDAVKSGVLVALQEIHEDHPTEGYVLHTALAQGSDRLVAGISRELPQMKLVVVQPVCAGKVLDAPLSGEDGTIVDELMRAASEIIHLPDAATSEAAYRSLGIYLAQECDVLLALWNGVVNHKPGGTSDVVAMARRLGKPVYWVYCDNKEAGASNPFNGRKRAGELELIRTEH